MSLLQAVAGVLSQQGAGGGISWDVGTVSTSTGTTNNGATAPAETVSGDLLVCLVFTDDDIDPTSTPTGWTEIRKGSSAGGSDRAYAVYARTADGTATDDPDFAWASSVTTDVWVIRFDGADSGVIADAGIKENSNTATPDSNTGGLSGGSGDVVIWGFIRGGAGATVTTHPSPNTTTQEMTVVDDEQYAWAIGTLTGPPGVGTWTISSSTLRWMTFTIIIGA